MDKFWQALAALLPTGFAWPRDPNSTLMRVIRALALSFNELYEFSRLTAFQFQPHQTVTRLAEWEESTGLPCDCLGADQTEAQRRGQLLARLRGPTLPYADSSPAAPAAFEALCASLGYTVTVGYAQPFRCGQRVDTRLGALDGNLFVRLPVTVTAFRCGVNRVGESLGVLVGWSGLVDTPFRVDVNRVGERLVSTPALGSELVCYLNRVVPARFAVNVAVIYQLI